MKHGYVGKPLDLRNFAGMLVVMKLLILIIGDE